MVAAYVFFSSSCPLHFSFRLSFNNMFQKAVPLQEVTSPAIPPSFYYILDIPLLLDCAQHFFIFHTICSADLLLPSAAPHFKNCEVFLIIY